MKSTITVADRREADAIKTALDDPTTRAFVVIVGTLLPLTPKERQRVMTFVGDKLDEEQTVTL